MSDSSTREALRGRWAIAAASLGLGSSTSTNS
jgi:hypothetical protein